MVPTYNSSYSYLKIQILQATYQGKYFLLFLTPVFVVQMSTIIIMQKAEYFNRLSEILSS